jgi:hypothetical protein
MEIDTGMEQEINKAAIAFSLTSALWFALATSMGMVAAGYLIAPDFMANIGWLQFSRPAGRSFLLCAQTGSNPTFQPETRHIQRHIMEHYYCHRGRHLGGRLHSG